jgi:Tfp pilus assembly pilus retraction ATPase PilT
MHSLDDLLHLLLSDGADALQLHAGQPPVVVLDGEPKPLLGPALTSEDVEQLFHQLTNTRQRRELRDHGTIDFIYRFRERACFVVRAGLENETLRLDIH